MASSPASIQPPPRAGTQSIERSVKIVTALASHMSQGWSLTDLARFCDLDRGTTRRMLMCLVRQRLAVHLPDEQRYLPGPLLFEWGLALPQHAALQRAGRTVLEQLDVGDAGRFLCLASWPGLVCCARVAIVDHNYLLKVGTRRTLIDSAAGAALLSALPRARAEQLFKDTLAEYERVRGKAPKSFRLMNKRSRKAGYGISEDDITPGWNAYAMPVRNGLGFPVAAIMVAARTVEVSPERAASMRVELAAAAAKLERGEAAHLY